MRKIWILGVPILFCVAGFLPAESPISAGTGGAVFSLDASSIGDLPLGVDGLAEGDIYRLESPWADASVYGPDGWSPWGRHLDFVSGPGTGQFRFIGPEGGPSSAPYPLRVEISPIDACLARASLIASLTALFFAVAIAFFVRIASSRRGGSGRLLHGLLVISGSLAVFVRVWPFLQFLPPPPTMESWNRLASISDAFFVVVALFRWSAESAKPAMRGLAVAVGIAAAVATALAVIPGAPASVGAYAFFAFAGAVATAGIFVERKVSGTIGSIVAAGAAIGAIAVRFVEPSIVAVAIPAACALVAWTASVARFKPSAPAEADAEALPVEQPLSASASSAALAAARAQGPADAASTGTEEGVAASVGTAAEGAPAGVAVGDDADPGFVPLPTEGANVSSIMYRFIPQEFLAILHKNSVADLALGDHVKRDMTIFFSDIRHFTSLSEDLTPEENFKFINSYLSRIVPVVTQYGGFVDKYIGDAVMALFADANGADAAVRAAIEMQKRIVEYNGHRAKCGYRPLAMGIGLHTGTLMLGIVGVENRMQNTVISDAVNLASRLESITKAFNISLAISEETFKSLDDPGAYMYRFIGKVRVKGKNEPVSVFEIFDGIDPESFERKMKASRFFEQGMMAYYQKDFSGSLYNFRKVLEILPEDGAAAFYLDNCLMKARM